LSSVDVLARVKAVLSRSVGPCGDGEPLVSTGRIDSLNIVELVLGLEQTFAIAIPEEEMKAESFETAEQIASLCRRRMAGGAPEIGS